MLDSQRLGFAWQHDSATRAETSTSGERLAAFSALLFSASAAVTIVRCGPTSGAREVPMPIGWTAKRVTFESTS